MWLAKEEDRLSHFAIACYRAKPGREEELLAVVREHMPALRAEGLVSDRPPHFMQAKDGTIIEVFEWKSSEAKDIAHRNEAVGKIWARFSACAEFPSLAELDETRHPFANFLAIEV
jgi:hypothetical protein